MYLNAPIISEPAGRGLCGSGVRQHNLPGLGVEGREAGGGGGGRHALPHPGGRAVGGGQLTGRQGRRLHLALDARDTRHAARSVLTVRLHKRII
jgi:hypothetical protein